MSLVGRIPSINLPLTNEQGIMHPIWYEFFRSVISNITTGDTSSGTIDIVAGAGLSYSGTTLNVGAGSGLSVDTTNVNVDISSQINSQAALEDEILISDASDGSRIRKTSLRDVAALAGSVPGGSNTFVQYNNNGAFDGTSGLTYDGAGSLGINSTLTINGTTFTSAASTNKFIFNVPAGSAADHFTFRQSGAGSSEMPMRIGSALASTNLVIDSDLDGAGTTLVESRLKFARRGVDKWTVGLEGSAGGSKFIFGTTALNAGIVYNIDPTNLFFNMVTSLTRSTEAAITASTTQTQGQRPLTVDVNAVATVANANDVVTLPIALAGRSCLVINNGANTLQVFPASGDNLGSGVNTSTTVTAGSRKLFVAFDSTNWEPVL